MKAKAAKYFISAYFLMMMALPALMAVSKAWQILPMAELRKISLVVWSLYLLLSAAMLMFMLRVRRKVKIDPEWRMAPEWNVDLPKPVKVVLLSLIPCFWFVYMFFSMWPVHQGLASVESRWQLAFLVGMLLLGSYSLARPRKASAQVAMPGTRVGLRETLLPRVIPVIVIATILNLVFSFWPIVR